MRQAFPFVAVMYHQVLIWSDCDQVPSKPSRPVISYNHRSQIGIGRENASDSETETNMNMNENESKAYYTLGKFSMEILSSQISCLPILYCTSENICNQTTNSKQLSSTLLRGYGNRYDIQYLQNVLSNLVLILVLNLLNFCPQNGPIPTIRSREDIGIDVVCYWVLSANNPVILLIVSHWRKVRSVISICKKRWNE